MLNHAESLNQTFIPSSYKILILCVFVCFVFRQFSEQIEADYVQSQYVLYIYTNMTHFYSIHVFKALKANRNYNNLITIYIFKNSKYKVLPLTAGSLS